MSRLEKILRGTLATSLPTAGAYGVFEYLLNNGEATKEFVRQHLGAGWPALLYQAGLWSLATIVENADLRASGLWENNRKGYVRQLANTAKWLVLEDISYWATQAAVTLRNPFPVDNWWARVFGPVGNLIGTPTPIIQVPFGYVLATAIMAGYLYWEHKSE